MKREVVTVKGLRELNNALAALPRAVSKRVQLEVLTRQAEKIAADARELAPKDTGDLKLSIMVGSKLSTRQAGIFKKEDPNDVVVHVGPGPLPQAHLQEFGTVKSPAQPFMRPAWDKARPVMLDEIKADLWASIQRAVVK